MTKKQKKIAKKVKYDTKRIGAWVIYNALAWANIFIILAIAKIEIPEFAINVVIWLLGLGIVLLLGRKFIAEFLTVKFLGKGK